MIFRSIQDKFKVKSGQKYLEDELNRTKPFSEKKGISNIACIVDMDAFGNAQVFQGLIKALGLKPNAVNIIGFKKSEDKAGMFSIPFVIEKDLGWNGSIENGDFSEFSGRNYDLLINYYTANRLVPKLMSVKINARLRVGLIDGDDALNDLIFNCKLGDMNTFQAELKKYLKILKEIK